MKRIQNLIALLAVIFLFTGAANTQTLLTEDFNYPAGQLLTDNGWVLSSGTGGIAVTSPGLTYSGYLNSGVGNAATVNNVTSEDDNLLFSSSVSSGTVYASAMINIGSQSGTPTYFFHLGNGTSTFIAKLFAKVDGTGYDFGITKAANTATTWTSTLSFGTTYLVVIKYTFVAGTANDLVDLFINPTPGGSEPAATLSAGDPTGSDISGGNISGIYLRQSSGIPEAIIDGIRAGVTWADVTPSGLPPTPCVLSLAALIQARFNGTAMVPDTATVELHDATSYALVDQDKELLSATGTGTFTFSSAANGTNYFIVIKNRNSLETWSASAHSFNSYAMSYDFTTSAAQAYGDKLILKEGKYCVYSGDVNQDGVINAADLTSVNADNSLGGAPPNGYHLVNDLNGDGWITGDDFVCIDNNRTNGITKSVPSGLILTGGLTTFSQTSAAPSAEQTYNISGSGLSSNVIVVPPSGFEISKTTGSGFVTSTGSLIFTAAEVIAGKTIYVRMNKSSEGNYSGNITHTSAGSEFEPVTLSVTGTYAIPASNVNLTMGNPSGATTDVNYPHNYLIDKSQLCISYDRDRGIANWVSWQLNSTWCNGPAVRLDNFIPDASLPPSYYHVTTNDYSGSGFSRGHMCPSADRVVTQGCNDSIFIMTNMVPQNQNNNAGAWEGLENYERTLANAGNTIYIICGGYGAGGTTTDGTQTVSTIAGGKVTVPAQLWKVMIVIPAGTGSDISRVTTSTRTIAMIIPNDSTPNSMNAWGNYRVSVDAVEALTGYDFFSNVDPSIQSVIEAKVDNGATQ